LVVERDGENESGLTKSKAVSGLAWHLAVSPSRDARLDRDRRRAQ
jgi:hypothetical protein